MESLKAQLAEANERINKLSADVHDKRGVAYKHHTLEELRNIQEQVQREKAVMAIQRERELTDLSVERTLLEDQRKQFEKDQVREPALNRAADYRRQNLVLLHKPILCTVKEHIF